MKDMTIHTLHEAIAELLRRRGLDRRTCYTHVAALAPDGATIEVDCSDPGLADELRRELAARDASARLRVRSLPLAGMPERMLVVSGVADVRRDPSHASELVSQAVLGDLVEPLKTEGEWVLARMDDGYIGWIRDWHLRAWSLAKRDSFAARAAHRVGANHATIHCAPSADSLPVAQLVVGTPVAAARAVRGWLSVELPDGRTGFARRADVEKTPHGRATPARLARTGRRFLGVPYLWGGTTPAGFDCSGLIQRIFRLHGILLPRDSDMQARWGVERIVDGPSGIAPGDLLFFGRTAEAITHVALVLPDGTFLHSHGQVVVNSLDEKSPAFLPRLLAIWRLTRRPLLTRSPGPPGGPPKKR
jgi:cell wall-associated NlpC family hydrolase